MMPVIFQKVRLFLVCVPFALCVSCQSGNSGSDVPGFPRDKTLYLGGFQWGDPNTFNPLYDFAAFPTSGTVNLMYEPLLVFNYLNGRIEPLLAQSYRVDKDVIQVTMDPHARWSDNTPLTAADVLFTFNMGKRFREMRVAYSLEYISRMVCDTIADGNAGMVERIKFYINPERNNPLRILDFFQEIHIVPKHVFSPLAEKAPDFSTLLKNNMDKNPVVSGPYTLHSYSGEKIVLERRDDYWGNAVFFNGQKPAPKYIIHPIYKSNDHYSIALQQGNLDISQTFIPRIWLKARKKVHTWYAHEPFFIPGVIPMIVINVTRAPLSDKNLRRAMAAAINYTDIRELAVSGYSPNLQPGLILPFGIEEKYFSAEDAAQFGVTYDTAKARAILRKAGYSSVFDEKGNLLEMKGPDGARVPTLFLKSPAGWTDWEIMVRIAVKGMRAVGIDVREGFFDAGLYNQNLPVGDFDLIMFTPTGTVSPSKPWSRFEAVMSALNWRPVGERMNENPGRYNNPSGPDYNRAIDSLIKVIPSLPEGPSRKAAYGALNRIFMQDQPTIPMVYRPEWFYEFSTRHWTGFPTEDDPYAPPQCLCAGAGTRALWRIHSAEER